MQQHILNDRRLRAIRWTLWAALACASVTQAAPQPGARPPNIVVVVADDWAFSDVGAFGGEISTPNLDALARRGVRFTNFHVAASCSPTRSMLLTGVDHHTAGVGNLRETMPREHRGRPGYLGSLAPNVVTVATLLKEGGYRTYIAGKWNVGSEPYNLPPERGFDRSIVQGDTGSDNWDPAQRYLPHTDRVEWFEDGKPANMPATYYSSEYFVDRAIGYLKQDAGKAQPFFAYLGFQANHVPLQAPPEFIRKYRGRYDQGWDALRTERRNRMAEMGLIPPQAPMAAMPTTESWSALSAPDKAYQARRMEVYAGMAEAMDYHLGRFVDYLRSTGELDNTVFVFLSDNGAEGSDYRDAQVWLMTQYSQSIDRLGGPGAYTILGPSWATATSAPFYGFKFYAGEGGIRTPMFIAGVPGAQAGAVQRSLTHVTDIAPTLLDLAGLAPQQGQHAGVAVAPVSGRSLAPLLSGAQRAVRSGDDVLGYELSGNLAVFRDHWKLVKNLPPVGDGQWHLYDLERDPGESQDLQAREPERFAAMQRDYEVYAREHGVLPMPEGYNPTRQVLINSIFNYWLPAYGRQGLALAAVLAGALGWWWGRRRKRRA